MICYAGTGDDPLQVAEELGWIMCARNRVWPSCLPDMKASLKTARATTAWNMRPSPAAQIHAGKVSCAGSHSYLRHRLFSRPHRLKTVMACPDMLAAAVPCAANQFIIMRNRTLSCIRPRCPSCSDLHQRRRYHIRRCQNTVSALLNTINYFAATMKSRNPFSTGHLSLLRLQDRQRNQWWSTMSTGTIVSS